MAEDVLRILLAAFVIMAAGVSLSSAGFVMLAAFHRFRNHRDRAATYLPRTAIVVPAHNEQAVIGTTIDNLLGLDYPSGALRVYVVDDASTDRTGTVVGAAANAHPDQVRYLRRDQGGEGKAAVLNHGLSVVLADDWAQAVMIIDADVLFEAGSLRIMTSHLADPRVGAVGAYIREGTPHGNSMTRFIGFEYVMAQALARRSSNLMGIAACLPGGAQLHSRANLDAIGGRIDADTLAEDTVTTFQTQIDGRMVIFEPRAIAWAEEPETIDGLWKQRLRWARGNLQVMRKYRSVWFRPTTTMGSPWFGLVWFSVTLQPLLILMSAVSLTTLYFINYGEAGILLRVFWLANALSWVVITAFGLAIDPYVARKSWLQAILFPGIVSIVIIAYTCLPNQVVAALDEFLRPLGTSFTGTDRHYEALFAAVWSAGCMLVVVAALGLERRLGLRRIGLAVVYVGGYGPLLCAIGLTAFVKQWLGADVHWEITQKTGRMGGSHGTMSPTPGALGEPR
jgi:cellulose synthase/poly-beta-1,6-N-acetylglucosamine synthase-like glycosyltransferase